MNLNLHVLVYLIYMHVYEFMIESFALISYA